MRQQMTRRGEEYVAARTALALLRELVRRDVIAEATDIRMAGRTPNEVHLSERYGVDRMTVRKWIGK